MTTYFQPIADGAAGEASAIAVQAFNDSEVLTALRNGSGNLELIGWHAATGDSTVTRGADSGTQAGTVHEVALSIIGRTAITAVRSGSNKLLLISWNIPAGLASITRLHDTGTAAGEASNIAMTVVGTDVLVTAVRNGSNNLELISWRLEPDQTISRLNDSGSQAGNVSWVTIAAIDSSNVVTAVRNGSNNLELIGWSVGSDGSLDRWGDSGSQAGTVTEIALTAVANGNPTADVLTAVQNGSGNLQVIAWRPQPGSGFTRMTDAGAGAASDLAVCTTSTPSGPKHIASMRRGAGNLELIAFDPIGIGVTNALVRTGDYENADNTQVSETALLSLDPGRILAAMRITGDGQPDNRLVVTTFTVGDAATTFIQPIADGAAGEASAIAVQAFNDSEVLTALRNGSGNLELITWHAAPGDSTVTRGADSGTQAGTVHEVALSIIGRTAITAVRSGSNKLLLISWNIPAGLTSITRLHDTGTAAGEASNIAMTVVGTDVLVTAVRNGSNNLELISWRLEPDQTISRLNDSGSQAGNVSWVTIAAIDSSNVVTAVRNGSNNLELIGWSVGSDGSLDRWGDSGSQAGTVTEIALTAVANGNPTADVVTAVQNGSGNLLVIAWRPQPGAGFTRLADDSDDGGAGSDIAICATTTASGPKTITSMRAGSSALSLIAFEEISGITATSIVQTGDFNGEPNNTITETALASLGAGRIVSALRITRKCKTPANRLWITVYGVFDPPPPAPSAILEIQFSNPTLPSGTDWAKSDGEFPASPSDTKEWVQVLAPSDDYEESSLVGCAGWIVAPDYSGADAPFDHPFGFDWEFLVALDNDKNGYQELLSPASTAPQESGISAVLAQEAGLPTANGLLGLEWDQTILPQSFRSRVKHGDRVAAFGRWILDTGHTFGGFWRTEIHPPLLMVAASVQQEVRGSPYTRALFMSRPFLSSQVYTTDLNTISDDSAPDDGTFFVHMVGELARIIAFRSSMIEVHPKIKSMPFKGSYRLQTIIRPPKRPARGNYQLVVSFQFTVRPGCTVAVTSNGLDAIEVVVTMDSRKYTPPMLPARRSCIYSLSELANLSSSAAILPEAADLAPFVAILLPILLPGVGAIILEFLVDYIDFYLQRGIKFDMYDPLPEINILDASHAVIDVPVANIPSGAGVVVDNTQPYPIFGWLDAKWIPSKKIPVGGTKAGSSGQRTSKKKQPAKKKKVVRK